MLFDAFSPIVHTKTLETADEHGDFLNLLKTLRFLVVWTREEKLKRYILSLPSAFSGVLVWTSENG